MSHRNNYEVYQRNLKAKWVDQDSRHPLPKALRKAPVDLKQDPRKKWVSDFDKASPRDKTIFYLERAKSTKQSNIKLARVSILERPERD